MIEVVKDICAEAISLDEILKKMYETMGMRTTVTQHALLSSTTKCYLTYLQDRGELECAFIDGIMTWKTVVSAERLTDNSGK